MQIMSELFKVTPEMFKAISESKVNELVISYNEGHMLYVWATENSTKFFDGDQSNCSIIKDTDSNGNYIAIKITKITNVYNQYFKIVFDVISIPVITLYFDINNMACNTKVVFFVGMNQFNVDVSMVSKGVTFKDFDSKEYNQLKDCIEHSIMTFITHCNNSFIPDDILTMAWTMKFNNEVIKTSIVMYDVNKHQ